MNRIWQYGNTQAVCVPTAYFLKSIGVGESRRGRRWRSLEGNSFLLLLKCHNSLDRLTSDVHLNLPPFPSCYYLLSDFFSWLLLSCQHTVHSFFFIFQPMSTPSTPVQPHSLSSLSCWIGISTERMEAVSLNWVKWGDDSGQWSHTLLPSLSLAHHSINMLRDRRAANANPCLLWRQRLGHGSHSLATSKRAMCCLKRKVEVEQDIKGK